ncbi:META domain-containing protein [Roseicyclus mahoneyensis]|uniref:Heat shock protein HslJ n=1 Tax=Roseicyclus mahoneyensis TaxID=164332 RepID=A0A316GEY8_9RHOB|nr:META domain-containing protein [Roseicyclus mahoneyensis]PWK59573.1 heat shock protein HslJ [Roseicyclus mahoneyensis]
MRLPVSLVAVLVTLAGGLGAQAQGCQTLSGSVTYLDRMALPPEAVLLVEVTDHDLRIEAEARIVTEGRQVPVPFTIEIPEGSEGTLRAGIATGGRVVWLAAPVAIDLGDDLDLGEIVLARHQPMGFVATYRCGDMPVRVGFTETAEAVMDVGDQRHLLAPVPAASGARYEAAVDPTTFFWSQGETALVSVAGAERPECRLALPLEDMSWHAGGNEPFWSVTVEAGMLTLTRLGMEDLVLALQDPLMTEAGEILVLADHADMPLRAVMLRRPAMCRDTMTGLPHPETVELSMGDQTIFGCGGAPLSLLTGRNWVVEDIAGSGVIDTSEVTLSFGTHGRVAGSGGCNRWFASYELTGEGLSIGQAGSTMMACTEALMTQERGFFAALEQVTGFDIDATGRLVLLGDGPTAITARADIDG